MIPHEQQTRTAGLEATAPAGSRQKRPCQIARAASMWYDRNVTSALFAAQFYWTIGEEKVRTEGRKPHGTTPKDTCPR